jgi:hypothetical protein
MRSCGAWMRGSTAGSAEGPYFFADLADTSEAEEQTAIDAGQIQAIGIRYAATRP